MSIFLSAEWRHVAMVSWAVDPALLRPLVPRGVELDDHEGRTYVSLVGFRFLDTRVLGLPIPGHRHFDEVNLRFYLRRHGPVGLERGVGFIREFVPRRAIAWVARVCYNEPYLALPMASTTAADEVRYRWKLARWHDLCLTLREPFTLPDPSSRDGWLAEHYWGWTRQRDGGTVAYRVEHPPWRIRPSAATTINADLAETYGSEWGDALSGPPDSSFVAEGSPVTVGRPTRVA